jgi:DNA-binding MarR family transcriptional regulator
MSGVGDAPRLRTGHLMRILLRQATQRSTEVLRDRGFGDLRPMHLLVIERLSVSETRGTDLAESIGLTKQATGQILDRMTDLGYVERVPDPVDGRAKIVQLTDRGRQAAGTMRSNAEDTDASWAQILGAARYRQLRSALASLIATSRH